MTDRDTREMSKRWNAFGRLDARYYIATETRHWDAEAFLASGRSIVEQVLNWIGEGVERGTMLEIGCGIGRMLLHFAQHFREAHGLDVAATMIEQARRQPLPENVHLHVGTGDDLRPFEDRSFDLVYSALVFQHIPAEAMIAGYLSETRRVLRPGGRAVLQFDTRPRSLVQRLYHALPDPLLPRPHRRYIRRYRREPDRLRELVSNAGLAVLEERHPASADHAFLLAVAS